MNRFAEVTLKRSAGLLSLFVFTIGLTSLHKIAKAQTADTASALSVTLADEGIKNAQITLETAGPVQIKTDVSFSGQVKLNTDMVAQVVPRLRGVVTKILKNLGDPVKKNEVIAIIESRELAHAKSNYIEAVHHLEFARSSFAREEALLKQKISAKEDYLKSQHAVEEAEVGKHMTGQKLLALGLKPTELTALVAKPIDKKSGLSLSDASLTRYEVRAAMDGIVIEKNVLLGEAVDEKTALFELADMDSVWVDARVRARDLTLLKVGQKTKVRSQNAGLESEGEMIYIGARFDEKTQMGLVRIRIQNPQKKWRPGLFVSVDLLEKAVSAAVAVSTEAIQVIGDRNAVFVQMGKRFEVRPVTLGASDGRRVEILEGLSGGEQVVTRNSFVIKAEWLNKGGELK